MKSSQTIVLLAAGVLAVASCGTPAPARSPTAGVAERSSAISAATGVRPLVTVLMALPGPTAPTSAQQWVNKTQTTNAAIPDNWTAGFTSDVTIDAVGGACASMKSIELDLHITHPRLADLFITASMVSADGTIVYKTQTLFDGPTNGRNGLTQAQLQQALGDDQDISMLTYAGGCGRLRVNVADFAPGATGTLDSLTVKVRTAWFPFVHDNAYYANLLFGPSSPNVNGFYVEESRGAFQFSNAGIFGPLPWGNWHVGETDEQHVQDIIAWLDALDFPFAQYDTNHDGTVDSNELQIVQFENSSDTNGANRGACAYANKAGIEVCVNAALVAQQTDFETLAHEISHTLGTVDLYGAWDQECLSLGLTLMSCTLIFPPDDRSTLYHDPWHRTQLGWLTPLQGGCNSYTLGDETRPTSPARFTNVNDANEFYLFEYRRPNGYDASVADSGVVAWHVKQNADGSPFTGVNGDQPAGHAIFALSPDAATGQKVGGARAWKPTDGPFQLAWLDGSPVGFTFSLTSNGASNGLTLDCVDPSRFSFTMGATATVAANDSVAVPINTTIGSCSPVQYAVTAGMSGVDTWVQVPSVTASGTNWMMLSVPETTAPGSGTITVTGSCGGMAESQTVAVTTTACVPTGCKSDSCGVISNSCGGTVTCGGCATGYTCQYGACAEPPTCHTPQQCCLQDGGVWVKNRCTYQ